MLSESFNTVAKEMVTYGFLDLTLLKATLLQALAKT